MFLFCKKRGEKLLLVEMCYLIARLAAGCKLHNTVARHCQPPVWLIMKQNPSKTGYLFICKRKKNIN